MIDFIRICLWLNMARWDEIKLILGRHAIDTIDDLFSQAWQWSWKNADASNANAPWKRAQQAAMKMWIENWLAQNQTN